MASRYLRNLGTATVNRPTTERVSQNKGRRVPRTFARAWTRWGGGRDGLTVFKTAAVHGRYTTIVRAKGTTYRLEAGSAQQDDPPPPARNKEKNDEMFMDEIAVAETHLHSLRISRTDLVAT